ncbi:TIM barrel protein [Devosia nitrariae]|nr:TIM barrel protein [Devosia nitrariae]
MVAPQLSLPEFFALARNLGMSSVEIRNDIAGQAILDGTPASTVRRWSADEGVDIISINALQKFNHWSADRASEAEALADYAAKCGARALVLVAANDGTRMADAERVANATESLVGLKPILASRGLAGFVECLGFEACSLRRKSEAVSAIRAADGAGVFTLTHDTFHHYLAGEAAMFPDRTGLVHISGVDHPEVAVSDMRDAHRLLVGPADRLGNLDQIAALRAAGCDAILSFEPFAEELRALADPAAAIRRSADYIIEGLARRAA